MKDRALIRDQLEKKVRWLKPLRDKPGPVKGWIRAVRDALGMNGRQLADRLGEHRSRTERIEKDELTGSVTLRTMRRAAEALDCVFVYGLVPRKTFEDSVRQQAELMARKRLARAAQTMALEDQSLGARENQKILKDMIEDLIENQPRNLWDKQS